MAKKITVVGPCEEMLKGVNVTSSPTGSPKVNGEAVPGGYSRTSSPDGVPEVTRDTNVGKEAKENVGDRG
jgi:hypothetical protein